MVIYPLGARLVFVMGYDGIVTDPNRHPPDQMNGDGYQFLFFCLELGIIL